MANRHRDLGDNNSGEVHRGWRRKNIKISDSSLLQDSAPMSHSTDKDQQSYFTTQSLSRDTKGESAVAVMEMEILEVKQSRTEDLEGGNDTQVDTAR